MHKIYYYLERNFYSIVSTIALALSIKLFYIFFVDKPNIYWSIFLILMGSLFLLFSFILSPMLSVLLNQKLRSQLKQQKDKIAEAILNNLTPYM